MNEGISDEKQSKSLPRTGTAQSFGEELATRVLMDHHSEASAKMRI